MPHAERQHQIVKASRRIITTRGMEHLTVRALAEYLDLSEAALYRHVKSKVDIIMLVLQDVQTSLLEDVHQAQQEESSALAMLQAILKAHLSYSERRQGLSFLVLNEALRFEDKGLRKAAGHVIERYLDTIHSVLSQGQANGDIRGDLDIEMAARLFLGMVQSNVTVWALRSRSYPLAEGHDALWDMYRRAIASPAQPQL